MISFFTLAVKTVPEGMNYTVERFGRFRKVLPPGLSFIVPIVDRIGYRIDMNERKLAFRFDDILTQDGENLNGKADVYVRISDPHKAAYGGRETDEALRLACEQNLKILAESRTHHDILSVDGNVGKELIKLMSAETTGLGLDIRAIDLHKLYTS